MKEQPLVQEEPNAMESTVIPVPLAPPDTYEPEQESLWPGIVDRNVSKAIDTYKEIQREKTETEKELIGIDKFIMLVFAIALLGSLFFTFYMIAVDKTDPVNRFMYPIITAILGFMSGYFAGTGRARRRD
jgi:hypothetical protein